MEIGNQIRGLRLHRGVTQEALAEALGVTPQAVSKWERDAGTPDIALLPALAAYFGVSIDALFALSDDTRMERIRNMLWDERVPDPALAEREREFLLEKGRREEAMDIWNGMLRAWPEERGALMCMGDYLARAGRYEEAEGCYRRSMEVQRRPRYTDGLTSIAHICEIQKDWAGAIAAREEELEVLRADWDTDEGELVERHRRRIAELKRKL